MKGTWPGAALALLALVGGADADPGSAKPRRVTARDGPGMAATVAGASELCGSRIAVKFDWTTPRGRLDPPERAAAERNCRNAVNGIRLVCKTAPGRQAVKGQITAVSCGVGGDAVVSLEDGILSYKVDLGPGSADDAEMVYRRLMASLRFDGEALIMHWLKPQADVDLAKVAARANEVCGSTIAARFDWNGMPPERIIGGDHANYCEHAFDAVTRICGDAAGKDAVKKRITGVVCGFAAGRSISLEGGVLRFYSDFKSSNDRSTILEYLQNAL